MKAFLQIYSVDKLLNLSRWFTEKVQPWFSRYANGQAPCFRNFLYRGADVISWEYCTNGLHFVEEGFK